MAPLRPLSPFEIPKILAMRGLIRTRPKKPITTEGMAARTSMAGLRISRILGGATSEMKAAQATPTGTARARAPKVTMSVLVTRERIPY